jgi:hypothetical protein
VSATSFRTDPLESASFRGPLWGDCGLAWFANVARSEDPPSPMRAGHRVAMWLALDVSYRSISRTSPSS